VGVPVAIHQYGEIENSRAVTALLAQKRSGLEAALRQTQEQAAETALPSSAVAGGSSRLAHREQFPAHRAPLSSNGGYTPPDPVVNDPVLQNLYLAAERAGLDALYAPLIRGFRLGPAQMDVFRDLIMKRHEQQMDLADIQQSHGLDRDDAALASLEQRASDALKAKLVELLGDAAYQQFNDYERTLPVRRLVDQFAGAVALEGQPLTTVQATDLTHVLAQASPPFIQGGTADPNQVEWKPALEAAARVLSEPQQQLFLNMAPRYPIQISGIDGPPGTLPPTGFSSATGD
jgi:hypothetical protein